MKTMVQMQQGTQDFMLRTEERFERQQELIVKMRSRSASPDARHPTHATACEGIASEGGPPKLEAHGDASYDVALHTQGVGEAERYAHQMNAVPNNPRCRGQRRKAR